MKMGSSFVQQRIKDGEVMENSTWVQNWYADDSACLAQLQFILEWLKLLIKEGPKYGYFPEPDKSYLVVHPNFIDEANKLFVDFKVNVVTGKRFLGGFVGGTQETEEWIGEKVRVWVKSINCLSKAAETQPHLAYVSLSKSLQNEWSFVQRVVLNLDKPFSLLKISIQSNFFPALFGAEVENFESSLMMMSTSTVGLGIRDPVKTSESSFHASYQGTKELSQAIISGCSCDLDGHEHQMKSTSIQARNSRRESELSEIENIFQTLPVQKRRTLSRILEGGCSTWLSMIPSHDNQFLMSANVFRDSLALRYARTPVKMINVCDGCSQPFDLCHALNCKVGGLVGARHNESRDLNLDLLQLTGLTQIVKEPIVKDSDKEGKNGLRADWGVRGFWEFQREALFDICIFNADAPSYISSSLDSLFNTARDRKKKKYSHAVEDRQATFTPIIATCDGIFDHEAMVYFKRISCLLSSKWKQPYSQVHSWLKARMQVCILRSVSLCIRGCRTKWRGAGIEHGAQIPLYAHF